MKKKEALRLLEMQAETNQDLHEVYATLCAKPKKATTTIEWISQFVADDKEPRDFLKFYKVEDNKAYASNGSYMFCCVIDASDGFYYPFTQLKSENTVCPASFADIFKNSFSDQPGEYTFDMSVVAKLSTHCHRSEQKNSIYCFENTVFAGKGVFLGQKI